MTRFETLNESLIEAWAKTDEREQKSRIAISQILTGFSDYLEVPEAHRIFAKPSEGLWTNYRSPPLSATERQEFNTWAGTLIIEMGNPNETRRLGFKIFVDFQDSGAEFWTLGDERRFAISRFDPTEMQPFFDHVYTNVLKELSDISGSAAPKNPIGFIWSR